MVKIKDDIYWVGALDWDLRNFHGYSTPFGSTYNAYLVLDQEPVLIDTVKAYSYEQMLNRIKQVIDPAKIKYIISNHVEMDHSGSLPNFLADYPQAQLICSAAAVAGLKRHFNADWPLRAVNSGETLKTGKYNFTFYPVPMVHWPDSMVTYLNSENILFSNDAFGQHYASKERFVDQLGLDIVLREAAKYYANIVLPYGAQVVKALEALAQLKIETICPSHGLIWRRLADIQVIVTNYQAWASHQTKPQAVIVYDTMWHSSELIAQTIYRFCEQLEIKATLLNLTTTHISDVVAEIMPAKAVIVGSPMLNNRMLPSLAGLLMYLKGLKPKNRVGFTFGSYGWAKAGFKELEESIKEAGIELISPGYYFQFVPNSEEIASLIEPVKKIKQVFDAAKL